MSNDGPAKNLCRQTTAEVTIAGVTIPADSRMMVLMGSANRDERVYPDPDVFDVFREFGPDNKILTFGEGIHSCMGAPIARMTAQIAVEELVACLAGTEVRVIGTPQRWVKQMVRGFAFLPVQFVGTGQERAASTELVPAVRVTSGPIRASSSSISTVSCRWRRASTRSASIVATMGSPAAARSGRRVAHCAISSRSPSPRSVILSASGAVTISALIWRWCECRDPVTVSEQHLPGGRPQHHRPDKSQHDRPLWPSDSST
jgi:hypothetical protein